VAKKSLKGKFETYVFFLSQKDEIFAECSTHGFLIVRGASTELVLLNPFFYIWGFIWKLLSGLIVDHWFW